jgi:hypothetical protein
MDCLFLFCGPSSRCHAMRDQLVVVLAQCSDELRARHRARLGIPFGYQYHPHAAPRSCQGRASDGLDRVGSLEFVGRFEEQGWKLAGATVPITYIAWSLWLILSGFVLVVR